MPKIHYNVNYIHSKIPCAWKIILIENWNTAHLSKYENYIYNIEAPVATYEFVKNTSQSLF